MFGRIAARVLLQALKSHTVQSAVIEVSRFAARRATVLLLRYLRGSKTLNDFSGARRIGP